MRVFAILAFWAAILVVIPFGMQIALRWVPGHCPACHTGSALHRACRRRSCPGHRGETLSSSYRTPPRVTRRPRTGVAGA